MTLFLVTLKMRIQVEFRSSNKSTYGAERTTRWYSHPLPPDTSPFTTLYVTLYHRVRYPYTTRYELIIKMIITKIEELKYNNIVNAVISFPVYVVNILNFLFYTKESVKIDTCILPAKVNRTVSNPSRNSFGISEPPTPYSARPLPPRFILLRGIL